LRPRMFPAVHPVYLVHSTTHALGLWASSGHGARPQAQGQWK
jgi:hypothetical protein